MLGLVESSFIPGGMRVAAFWFPAQERGIAAGVFNLGASFGAILAPPLIAWSILHYDWHAAFMIVGGLALAWATLWLVLYRNPDRHQALSTEEAAFIAAGQEPMLRAHDEEKPSLREILKERNFWGIALPRFFADPVWGTLGYWMPLYLYQARGFDPKTIAMTAWLPFVTADLGCLMGGSLSAWLKARFGTPIIDGKRMVFTLGALLMVAMAGVGLVSNPATAIFLLCLGGFAHQTLSVAVISMSADLFPRREVATVTGLVALIAGLGNLAFTLVIGGLVGLVGYTPFFVVLGFLDLIGATILWTVVWTVVKPATELLREPMPGALGGTDSPQRHRGHQGESKN